MSTRRTIIAALVALTLTAPAPGGGFVNKPFPDFEAQDAISGEAITLSDFRGRVVILDFWATWCAPCRGELPHVKRLWTDYRDEGLAIIGVSLDSSDSRFKAYVRQNQMDWSHVMEGDGWRSRLVREYRVQSIPRVFVIGPDGTCLAETNRIRNVEAIIRKALSEVDPDAVDRDGRADLPPGIDVRRLREIQRELDALAEPLRNYEQSLGLLERIIGGLDRQLRQTGSARTLDRRYRYLLAQLTAARRELFAMGLLAEAPVLPGDPFAAPDASDATLSSQVAAQLQVARDTLVPLKDAVETGLAQVEPLVLELESLRADAPSADPDAWTVRVTEVGDRADAVVATLARGTQAAIARIDERLAGYQRTADQQSRLLDNLCVGLSGLQNDLAATIDGSLDIVTLRPGTAELTETVKTLAAMHGIQTPLADDPFQGRDPADDGLAADLAAHLRVADDVAARVDAAVAGRRAHLANLALQAQALRESQARQVVDATVKRQIDALTDRVLALATGS